MMEWATVTKTHTPPFAKRHCLPDEHALYKDNFATRNAFSSPEAADQKERDFCGREYRKRMPKVIADIAQQCCCGFDSLTLNINA